MTIYTVLEPPDGKLDRVAFVPEGFAWGALVFTVLWALWHRLWFAAALLFAASAALNVAITLDALDPVSGSLVQFAIALFFGLEARRIQAAGLEQSGFRQAGLVQASSPEAAELAYFAGRSSARPAATPARYHAAPEDTLGIFGNV